MLPGHGPYSGRLRGSPNPDLLDLRFDFYGLNSLGPFVADGVRMD